MRLRNERFTLIFGNIGYHRVIETGFSRGLRIESRIGIEIGPGNRYPARPLMGLVGLILAVFGFVTY